MQPLVTIAIPTYKRLNYLKEAVASALNQSYEPIQILIGQDPSDNGLDKEIKEWVMEVAINNPKVKYFFNEKNLGLAGHWNALISEASGEYMMIIGDDDRLLPDAVEKLMFVVLPDKNVAFSNHFLIDQNGSRLVDESLHNTKKFNRDKLQEGMIENPTGTVWQNAVPISATIMRKEDIKRLRFKEDLNTPEIELFLRLANEGARFYFIPDYTVEYRIHSQSATHSGLKVHHLLNYLIPMEVGNKNDIYKKKFIQKLIGSAVNLHIKDGHVKEARKLYMSPYYPLKLKISPKGVVQFVCICFPSILSIKILNFFSRLSFIYELLRKSY